MRLPCFDFVQLLESVHYGLAPRETVEQSTCFVFDNGVLHTYNDKVACRIRNPLLKNLHGAVRSKTFLKVIRRIKDEYIEVTTDEQKITIKGKRSSSSFALEKDILLPYKNVEVPENWKSLHPDFLDALAIVQECASKDAEKYALTCVHMHPKWLEACDGFQIARHRIDMGIEESCWVEKESIQHIVALGMSKFAITPSWVHFRNPSGLVYSCRRLLTLEYPNLTPLLKTEGENLVIPKNLKESIEKAKIVEEEKAKELLTVTVELFPGKMVIKGKGILSEYREYRKTKYAGKPVSFIILADVLLEISKKYYDCIVGENKILITGGKWKYVSCLGKATP